MAQIIHGTSLRGAKPRSNLSYFSLFMFVFLLSASFTSSAHAEVPFFTKIAATNKEIDLSQAGKTSIQFTTPRKMFVNLKIYNEARVLQKFLSSPQELQPGRHRLEWDGRNDQGEQVTSGVYYYVLEALREPDLEPTYVYDPSLESLGEEVFVERLTWDRNKSKIKYLLPRAAYTRVRIGIKEGVFLGALEDWKPQAAGQKEISWNGIDASGLYDLTKRLDAQINVAAFAVADNTIFVKSPALPKETLISSALPEVSTHRYIHARHPRLLCHEPVFQVSFPDAALHGKDSMPFLEGKAPVRIVIDPKDKDYLVANRFEIMFFVDGQFLYEQEEATSPLTAAVDTTQFGPGEHILTVNVMDYEDHIGAYSVKIAVPATQELTHV